MARKPRKNLEYFTLDVVFSDSIRLACKEIGEAHALSLLIELWQKTYGSHGYYMNFDKDNRILFLDYSITKIGLSELDRCLNIFFERKIFNKILFDKYGILTSDSIQERYIYICNSSKRANVEIIKEYICFNYSECDLSKFNVRSLNQNNSEIITDEVIDDVINIEEIHSQQNNYGNNNTDSVITSEESTQIKEKEIKGNEIKEKNNLFYFSEIIEELKKESSQKELILAKYKIDNKTLDKYIDFFNFQYVPEEDQKIYDLNNKRNHFKNFLKLNYNKLPQINEQRPKIKIL